MQLGGDAGLEVRVPVQGRAARGRRVVREGAVGAGRPAAAAAAGPGDRRTTRSTWITRTWARSRSAALTERPDRRRTRRAAARFSSASPRLAAEERACATKILSRMARLAYRRPVTKPDVADAARVLRQRPARRRKLRRRHSVRARTHAGRSGLPAARPSRSGPSSRRRPRIGSSDLELASRLSFFLWSSIPDDRLLTLAERGQLTNPAVLEKEVRRMLADPRATDALVDDFAAQWLNLRRVEEVVVDPEQLSQLRPEPAAGLPAGNRAVRRQHDARGSQRRRSARTPTTRSSTNGWRGTTGFPGVYGSRFRRVTLPNHDQRGGLLGQGALLATTSYPDRTSPVLRGKWLLNNIFGLPVPPPPPGVDTNLENKPGARAEVDARAAGAAPAESVVQQLSFGHRSAGVRARELRRDRRMADRSTRPASRWTPAARPLSGAKVDGLAGLRALLLDQPEQFPRTVTEKLLAYALGRRLEYYDRPAVRKIVRDAAAQRLPLVVADSGNCQESGVSDAGTYARTPSN